MTIFCQASAVSVTWYIYNNRTGLYFSPNNPLFLSFCVIVFSLFRLSPSLCMCIKSCCCSTPLQRQQKQYFLFHAETGSLRRAACLRRLREDVYTSPRSSCRAERRFPSFSFQSRSEAEDPRLVRVRHGATFPLLWLVQVTIRSILCVTVGGRKCLIIGILNARRGCVATGRLQLIASLIGLPVCVSPRVLRSPRLGSAPAAAR